MKRLRILGIPYDDVNTEQALSLVENFVQDDKSRIIIHLSLPLLMLARRNRLLRTFLEESDLIIPSGRNIYWAAKLLKRSPKELIDPSLFVKMLMAQSAELGKKVYLFGGKGSTIDKAYKNLKREIQRLFVLGKHRGDYKKLDHENILTAIGKASPDYFFIGLGSPAEEYWILRNKSALNAKLIILVEGLFDLFAGNLKKRASYNKNWSVEKIPIREIPQQGSFKKVWIKPLFVLSVYIEKLFWKN
jgi:N-acetylglucosaminyldiphosphoundecaprenol N-acetyl-beta-D-mannosaminyltransferase